MQSLYDPTSQFLLCTRLNETFIESLYTGEEDRLNGRQRTAGSLARHRDVPRTRILLFEITNEGNFSSSNLYFSSLHHRLKRWDESRIHSSKLSMKSLMVFLLFRFVKSSLSIQPGQRIKSAQLLLQNGVLSHMICKSDQIVPTNSLKPFQFWIFNSSQGVQLSPHQSHICILMGLSTPFKTTDSLSSLQDLVSTASNRRRDL